MKVKKANEFQFIPISVTFESREELNHLIYALTKLKSHPDYSEKASYAKSAEEFKQAVFNVSFSAC